MKKYKNTKTDEKQNIIVTICGAIGFFIIVLMVLMNFYQMTDNAFIEGRTIAIESKIEGQVIHLYATDNQEVKKGDLLLEIDPSDYKNKLEQTEIQLYTLQQKLNEKSIMDENYQKNNNIGVKGNFDNYSKMYGLDNNSKPNNEQVQNVDNENYQIPPEKKKNAKASDFDNMTPCGLEMKMKELNAKIAQYKLALSYTKIYAPQDGVISSKNVIDGDYVQVGQALMNIVPKRVWVVANFSENQLQNIEVGQPVFIRLNAYPRRFFKGVVDSIQKSKEQEINNQEPFSMPSDRFTGDYVKIEFTEDYSDFNIAPGTSVKAIVKIK